MDQPPCAHERRTAYQLRHRVDDPRLGHSICADCYDYERSVLWNATCPELWRRTTIYVRRELARLCDMNVKELDQSVRLSFAKVDASIDRYLRAFESGSMPEGCAVNE